MSRLFVGGPAMGRITQVAWAHGGRRVRLDSMHTGREPGKEWIFHRRRKRARASNARRVGGGMSALVATSQAVDVFAHRLLLALGRVRVCGCGRVGACRAAGMWYRRCLSSHDMRGRLGRLSTDAPCTRRMRAPICPACLSSRSCPGFVSSSGLVRIGAPTRAVGSGPSAGGSPRAPERARIRCGPELRCRTARICRGPL